MVFKLCSKKEEWFSTQNKFWSRLQKDQYQFPNAKYEPMEEARHVLPQVWYANRTSNSYLDQNDEHNSPVIPTRTIPIFKMMESTWIPNSYLPPNYLWYQLDCSMTIWTSSQIFHYQYRWSFRCTNQCKCYCQTLAVVHQWFWFNIFIPIMKRAASVRLVT